MICEKCGTEVDRDGSLCSADDNTLICYGHRPVGGCGAILTAEERHWYGSCCEKCEQSWGNRIESWRLGSNDPELDEMFGSLRRVH